MRGIASLTVIGPRGMYMHQSAKTEAAQKHVVIIGGGFAGLNCAKKLASGSSLRITLIDKNNYQQFQPLLYQVAMGILSPENAAFNLRDVFVHDQNVEVKMSEIVSVDLTARRASGRDGDVYQGDYLVLAAGSVANFFRIRSAFAPVFWRSSKRPIERVDLQKRPACGL